MEKEKKKIKNDIKRRITQKSLITKHFNFYMKVTKYYFILLFLLLLSFNFSVSGQTFIYSTSHVSGTSSATGAVQTAGSNRYLMVFVHYTGVSITNVRYNGVNLTAGAGSAGTTYKTASYYMDDPPSGTYTLAVNVSGTGSFYSTALSFSYVTGFSWSGTASFTNLNNSTTGGLSVGARDMLVAAVTTSAGTITEASPTINISKVTSPIRSCDSRLAVGVSNAITWNFSANVSGDVVYYVMTGVNSLPIELLNFTAFTQEDKTIRAEWITTSQTNNDYFTIERSKDASSFEPVGTIAGAGTTTRQQEYSFVDDHPYKGISYYRLRQTDYDGKSEAFYWKAVHLKEDDEGQLHLDIATNPVIDGNLSIDLSDNSLTGVLLQIIDVTGKIVYQHHVSTAESRRIELTDIGKTLAAGTYILIAKNSNEVKSKYFMVLK